MALSRTSPSIFLQSHEHGVLRTVQLEETDGTAPVVMGENNSETSTPTQDFRYSSGVAHDELLRSPTFMFSGTALRRLLYAVAVLRVPSWSLP